MRLLRLKAINFRNLKDLNNLEFDTLARDYYLIGNNGQGKTNFIEGIYFLSFASSFRTNLTRRIIRHGEQSAYLACTILNDDGQRRDISITIHTNKSKEIRYNSKNIDDRKLLVGNTACIVFSHEDMEFVSGAPSKKRQFINQTAMLCDSDFIDTFRKYSRVLKSRNIALKSQKHEIAELYDENLADYGLIIQKKRQDVLKEFNLTFSMVFSEITGDINGMELVYKQSWKSSEKREIIDQLRRQSEKDKIAGTTTSGPHRDDFVYVTSGKNYVHFGSTGQLRLVSLILRAAQLRFLSLKTNKKYIVLLDDVLLELDSEKRNGFLRQLEGYEQAFFTFLPDDPNIDYEGRSNSILLIENGEIRAWKKQEKS